MPVSFKEDRSNGFSFIEAALVIVALVIVGAVGYLFYHNSTKKPVSTAQSSVSQVVTPAGTTASIAQLAQQGADTEANIDSSSDNQTEQNAVSSDSAVSNVGSAYNENNL